MPIYKYSATDNNGSRKVGTVDARTEELAVNLLRNQGFYVINLDHQRLSIFEHLNELRGVGQGDIVTFTRQFSTMISAGLPISRALEVLAEQASNNSLKKIIFDVLRDVEGGAPLSTALGRFPRAFSPTYQALVRAGESSGKLDEILKRLANSMEADRELQAKFKSAMVYPAIVFIAMIGVFVMLMVFVVPKLADMYESLNVDLPWMTQVMIDVSGFMVKRFYVVIAAAVGLVFGIKTFLASEDGKRIFSTMMFNLPVFGKINRQREITQFTRTLGLLISSAIPIVEALKIVSNVVSNHQYRSGALEAATIVEKGGSLSEYFRYNKNFPALMGQMINVGEETGQLDSVLEKVASYFNGEVDNAVAGLSAALEPIILVMLGGMVGVLIISIITPIYKITTSI
jgi:type IV pilus assembly protein PilC